MQKTTATKPSKEKSIEEAVSYAVGHRIRVEVLCLLNEGTRSADELARLTHQPLSKLGHHIKALLDARSIEIARTEKVRNVSQNYYRAVEIPYFSDEQMAAKTPQERQEIYGLILQASMAEAIGSFWAGKITNDPRAWLSWSWFNVDEQGRRDIADEQQRSWDRVQEIEAESTNRRAESGEESISIIVTTFGYERSRAVAASIIDNGKN